MKAKDKQPDELRIKASDFDNMMRKALGAAPVEPVKAKRKPAKAKAKPKE